MYVVDSAGALVLDGVADRVPARWSPSSVTTLRSVSTVTRTWDSGVANSVEAVRAGAKQIDGSVVRRFGAGAGNAPVEALIGVFDKIGVKTGIDFFDIADAAEEIVAPAMPAECLLDRNALIMGYSGVTQLPQARHPAGRATGCRPTNRCTVPACTKLIGGQEDQLIDTRWRSSASAETTAAVTRRRVSRVTTAVWTHPARP